MPLTVNYVFRGISKSTGAIFFLTLIFKRIQRKLLPGSIQITAGKKMCPLPLRLMRRDMSQHKRPVVEESLIAFHARALG